MTTVRSLHFCSSNRAWALGQHRALVRGVLEKLLPAFECVESEARAFAEAEYERLACRPSWDGDVDMVAVTEEAIERGHERCQDLVFVQGQLQALSIASLYHLCERTLKEFLVRELGWKGTSEKFIQRIRRAGFNKLIGILEKLDFAVCDQSFFNGLETVSLFANTCKHGDGPAFRRLAEKAPEFLCGPYQNGPLFLNTKLEPDDLWIEASKIEELESAIDQFWLSMPEHLPIPENSC